MIILATPVVGQKELTKQLLRSLEATVSNKDEFLFVVIDNGWEKVNGKSQRYTKKDIASDSIKTELITNKENPGYYYPLKQIHDKYKSTYPQAYYGLIHNDIIVYEVGWDNRLESEFKKDSLLHCIGFCGSSDVDELGGRGAGTMCHFRGEKGQLQEHTGALINGLFPALILDSLFMMFTSDSIPLLNINENIAPCHFYDKIWPMTLVERGLRVAVLGVEIDHIGGQTAVLSTQFIDDCRIWLEKMALPLTDDPRLGVYLEAERRFLYQFKTLNKMIPAHINLDYGVVWLNR